MKINKTYLKLILICCFACVSPQISASTHVSDTIKGMFTIDKKYHINDVYVYLISNESGEKYRLVSKATENRKGKKIKEKKSYYLKAIPFLTEFVHGITYEFYKGVFIHVDDGYGWNLYTSDNVDGKYYLSK